MYAYFCAQEIFHPLPLLGDGNTKTCHDNYCTWVGADGQLRRTPEDGVALLQAVREHLAAHGIEAALEASRRGAHLWVFAQEPVPGHEMRVLLEWAAQGQAVEIYPKQDHRGTGVGSNIRAPLGVHRVSSERYPFVDERGQPVAQTMGSQIAYVAQLQPVDVRHEVTRLGLEAQAHSNGLPASTLEGHGNRHDSSGSVMHLLSRARPWQRSPIKE